MGGLFRGLSATWGNIPRFWQNMIVGVVIALALPLMRDTEWEKSAQNLAMDTMINLNASLDRMTAEAQGKGVHEFTFLEIDEKSYRSWNEPYHIPRDKLLSLIRFSLQGGAKIVVVDVDLTKPGTDSKADKALLDYLSALPPEDRKRLIMLRVTSTADFAAKQPPFETLRATIVDTANAPGINWAHPYFKKDISDRLVRRWDLILRGCFGGKPVTLPSVQLLTVMLSKGDKAKQDIEAKINKGLPEACEDLAKPTPVTEKLISAYGYDLSSKGLTERIIYTMPWERATNRGSPDLVSIPAHIITESTTPPASDSVKDRIVFIGASYAASHDLHETPLGPMPGAMVLVNASKSLLVLGQIKPPSPFIVWPAIFVLIILMSLTFSIFPKMAATLIITVLVIVVLIPISFFLFSYGIWFDFAAPLLAIQAHQLFAEFNRH